jgi:hypothetical protein
MVVVMVAMEIGKWRRLGLVKMDDEGSVRALLDGIMSTFRWDPLYKSCLGERGPSVSTRNDRSCECSLSHGTSTFALFSLVCLLLISSISFYIPFHIPT